MTNVTKTTMAACAGAIALACAAAQPASAADIQAYPQYGGPPPVEENYVYQAPRPAYRYVPAAPPVYYEHAPPAVVVVPQQYYEPYYVRPRAYVQRGYGPYYAGGYGYRRHHQHHHHHHHDRGRNWGHGHRRW